MRVFLTLILLCGPLLAGDKQHPPPLERLQRMTPAQRQRALARVPPERRQRIQQRLDKLEKLSPDEKARVKRFRELPPEKQQAVRQGLNQMTRLPPDRQQALRTELLHMRGLPAAEREARMGSSDFKSHYSGHERKLIEKLSDVVPE